MAKSNPDSKTKVDLNMGHANVTVLMGGENKEGESDQLGGKPEQFELHFPEEVWLLILKMVEDVDLVNCCRASPYLDNVLTPSKPDFLGQQVLPLVGKWLSRNELLNCREVCKKWCAGVDQLSYMRRSSTTYLDSDCWFQFHNQQEIDHFTQTFARHVKNPFIDGTLYIVDNDEDVQYPEGVLNLLRRFGHYVRIFIVEDFCEVLDPLKYYQFLQKALTFTPNLTQLKIIEHGLFEHYAEPSSRELMELNSCMVEHPLPFIKNLDLLWINMEGNVARSLQNIHNMLILPYAGQLKTLSMRMPYWKDHYASRTINLKKFIAFEVNSEETLSRIREFTAPLKTLSLSVSGNLQVGALLGLLKTCPSVEEVSIEFSVSGRKLERDDDPSTFGDLSVPNVKSLDVIDSATLSYNFIQKFTSLRRLFVGIDAGMDTKSLAKDEGDKNLQLFKVVEDGKLYESNVWELIPNLQQAEIQFQSSDGSWRSHSGTREGYISHLERSN